MKLIPEMTHVEFHAFMLGGQRMLRINAMSWARIERDAGRSPVAYVKAARHYQRGMLDYLRRYRAAKAAQADKVATLGALKVAIGALQGARA